MDMTVKQAHRLNVTQRAKERSMLGIWLRDKTWNEVIRHQAKVIDIVQNCSGSGFVIYFYPFVGSRICPRTKKKGTSKCSAGRPSLMERRPEESSWQ